MVCVYCCDSFDDPSLFRKHMSEHHPDVKISMAFAHVPDGYIKIDCTDLRCRICSISLNNLNDAIDHLVKVHRRKIDSTCDLGVQPFILPDEKWECSICNSKFITLCALSAHTQSHFAKHTCETCGKSYFYIKDLKTHIQMAHICKQWICIKCKAVFETLDAKKKHLRDSPLCWSFTCTVCGERFLTFTMKKAHRAQAHGIRPKSYVCSECPKVFTCRGAYKNHFVAAHTKYESVPCPCGKEFKSKAALKKHMVVHSNDKVYSCTVCSKAFSRKKTLIQHMWIHSERKRFECVDCNKQFNQRVSWKTHMKSYHPGIAIT